MIECVDCDQDERFLQHNAGYVRRVRLLAERGSFRAQKGPWKPAAESGGDGFYCDACGASVTVRPRLITTFGLDEAPAAVSSGPTLDELLARIQACAGGATLHIEKIGAREGRYRDIAELGKPIMDELHDGAERLGVSLDQLYAHQVEALGHIFAGKNVVVQTPTASGKSLVYLLPIFHELLRDPEATALLVFPAKGLSFDQRKKIAQFSEGFDQALGAEEGKAVWPLRFGKTTIGLGAYDGDTQGEDQAAVKQGARIIVTTPDALHYKILPHFSTKTGTWERFLRNLRIVVLDELHMYRGLFGAHVAYVIRRLRMMCERLSAAPQFICSSATLPRPQAHAEQLVGLPFEAVTESGAPTHPKALVLWNPAMQKKARSGEGERREPTTDAIEIASRGLLLPGQPLQTITFIRSLAGVQKFHLTLEKRLHEQKSPFAGKIATYSGRSDRWEREEISSGLITGQIVHVTSTNALELGIDIGDLSACMMVGYPGTVASFLQQSGRVGRKDAGIVVLLLHDDPLEQWFGRNPRAFFQRLANVEPVRLPIDNPFVLAQQAACAAHDLEPSKPERVVLRGLTADLFSRYFGKDAQKKIEGALERLELLPPQLRRGGTQYWVVKGEFNDIYQNIRTPISVGKFEVRAGKELAGLCDSTLVPRDLFPGAIWANNGRIYRSKKIHYADGRVDVERLDRTDYSTIALPRVTLEPHPKAESKSASGCTLSRGGVTVTRKVEQYLEVPAVPAANEKPPVKGTRTNPIEYESTAFWLDLPSQVLRKAGVGPEDAWAAVHALEHTMRAVFPFVADVDPGDIGSSAQLLDTGNDTQSARLYLFDNFAGGTGLSDFAYENARMLLDRAEELLGCTCKLPEGCPRCTIISWCEYRNEQLSKNGARKLLAALKGVR
ncbi:DEAD/DEAH box helicase [Polyangium sorediatum]|uniref:DEAD/DEAH box helicase n=1 Tax=Polyangium sorediatum TaxID=889274 RepID=A0ABT6P959_9BACT|nr:DEAD/DEAH box helicase [Polyangium sorediatum]MDI1437116.1 DEAD/DEAH box helicase [Polyangium sorediatum]